MSDHLLRWRCAVISEHGPESSTARHVLLTLSVFMDGDGKAWPATRTLATATGLSRRAVMTHLAAAEEAGWIRREEGGAGQGWKHHTYYATLPNPAMNVVNEDDHLRGEAGSPPTHERGEPHARRGEPDDTNVVNEVHLNSSRNSSKNSLSPKPRKESAPEPPTKKEAAREGVRFPLEDVERIRKAYPRQVKAPLARAAIRRALVDLHRRGQHDPVKALLDAVAKFATSPAGKKGRFTPEAHNWFDNSQYDDDPKEWYVNDSGGYAPTPGTPEHKAWTEKRWSFDKEERTEEEERQRREHWLRTQYPERYGAVTGGATVATEGQA